MKNQIKFYSNLKSETLINSKIEIFKHFKIGIQQSIRNHQQNGNNGTKK